MARNFHSVLILVIIVPCLVISQKLMGDGASSNQKLNSVSSILREEVDKRIEKMKEGLVIYNLKAELTETKEKLNSIIEENEKLTRANNDLIQELANYKNEGQVRESDIVGNYEQITHKCPVYLEICHDTLQDCKQDESSCDKKLSSCSTEHGDCLSMLSSCNSSLAEVLASSKQLQSCTVIVDRCVNDLKSCKKGLKECDSFNTKCSRQRYNCLTKKDQCCDDFETCREDLNSCQQSNENLNAILSKCNKDLQKDSNVKHEVKLKHIEISKGECMYERNKCKAELNNCVSDRTDCKANLEIVTKMKDECEDTKLAATRKPSSWHGIIVAPEYEI